MPESRREFLARTAVGVVGVAAVSRVAVEAQAAPPPPQATPVAGTPPAFGTARRVGPEVSAATFAEAEKLVRVELTTAERAQAAGNWRQAMAGVMERRTGPRKVALEASLAPATRWDPMIPGVPAGPASDRFVRSAAGPGTLAKRDEGMPVALTRRSRRENTAARSTGFPGGRRTSWTRRVSGQRGAPSRTGTASPTPTPPSSCASTGPGPSSWRNSPSARWP